MRRTPIKQSIIMASLMVGLMAGLATEARSTVSRLDHKVVPVFQTIELVIDADKADYSGTVVIELQVNEPANSFRFHAESMTLDRIELSGPDGLIKTESESGGRGLVTLTTSEILAAGAYSLEIDFVNNFDTQAVGLYKVSTEGNNYTFTQFEADDAREAFPCWDEPVFKIPFQLTLVVPEEHEAVSNTPVESQTVEAGMKRVRFLKTKPLPSYLLAIATGPLEFVDIPGMSVPGRVVTVKGKSSLTADAVELTPPILAALENYFGRPYPYAKLDLIAVPEFWFGAMENAGAVVYREPILAIDPDYRSAEDVRRLAAITAHELAHMWFGDLVTMEWWDDIWLNESFASWLGTKITYEVYPEFKSDIASLKGANRAMLTDSRPSTHAMRRPVAADDNLMQAFDALAYQKGQVILEMFEGWIGEDKFRQGVREYMDTHAWGNATADDFWLSLSKAGGEDITAAMSPYLNQEGLPLVTLENIGDGLVRLTQKRFSNHGVTFEKGANWPIPMQIRFSDGVNVHTKSVLLDSAVMTVHLPTERELAWVYPNADSKGYYRWLLPSEELARLANAAPLALGARERVGFLMNSAALLDAGEIEGDQYLEMLSAFADDPEPKVIQALISGLGKVRDALVLPEMSDLFSAYVRKLIAPAVKRFGLESRPGEEVTVTMLRPDLIRWLADEGRDKEVRQSASEMAVSYLKDPSSIDPQLVEIVIILSAHDGDRAMFADYRNRFETATKPTDRRLFLTALGSFRRPEIVDEALAYVLTGPLRPQEVKSIPQTIARYAPHQDRVFDWLMKNYDELVQYIPEMYTASLPQFASGCSASRLELALDFFDDSTHVVTGTDEELAKVSDQVTDCVSLRERQGLAVSNYLQQLGATE